MIEFWLQICLTSQYLWTFEILNDKISWSFLILEYSSAWYQSLSHQNHKLLEDLVTGYLFFNLWPYSRNIYLFYSEWYLGLISPFEKNYFLLHTERDSTSNKLLWVILKHLLERRCKRNTVFYSSLNFDEFLITIEMYKLYIYK